MFSETEHGFIKWIVWQFFNDFDPKSMLGMCSEVETLEGTFLLPGLLAATDWGCNEVMRVE